jgi:solute carrier family 50 (sugar transporter)
VEKIKREKTTGNLSPLPFLSLATNCMVWSLYGALVSDLTVLIPNMSGAALGIYYTSVFNKYSPTSLVPQVLVGGGIVGAAASMALTLPADQAAQYIGYTGCTLAVILMASPLATMATVLRERSTASMPFITSVVRQGALCPAWRPQRSHLLDLLHRFFFCICQTLTRPQATFLNASAWASYGVFVAHDPIIWGPNVLGLAAACVQLSLFARFGRAVTESE